MIYGNTAVILMVIAVVVVVVGLACVGTYLLNRSVDRSAG